MAGINVSEIINLGGADVYIGGVSVGHTDEAGVKVAVKSALVDAKTGKYGEVAVRKFVNGQKAEVEFTLVQTANWDGIASALPAASIVTSSGGSKKMTFGKIAGSEISAVALRLKSFLTANTPGYDFVVTRAVPIGDFEITYDGKEVQKWKCKFDCLIDEAGGSDGAFLFTFGDPTVSADVVAPTVSTVVPADAATGVSASTTVVWTCSKNLSGNTVNTTNVKVFKDPTGSGATGLEVAGSVVLANAGAATTITFTPSSALGTGIKYVAVLQNVKDLAGNSLASGFYATEFTIA